MYRNKEDVILKLRSCKAVYKDFDVDVDKAIEKFKTIPISLHCWQGDDVKGFEDLGDGKSERSYRQLSRCC